MPFAFNGFRSGTGTPLDLDKQALEKKQTGAGAKQKRKRSLLSHSGRKAQLMAGPKGYARPWQCLADKFVQYLRLIGLFFNEVQSS